MQTADSSNGSPIFAMTQIQVKPLDKTNEAQAQAIIEAGLTQHWKVYDSSFNLDVSDLLNHYEDRLMTFWLNGEMTATGAWIVLNPETVFFVRVSVVEKLQGKGIGSQVMTLLEQHVATLGFKFAELETTTDWDQVVRFYLKLGYEITHELDGDTYFRKAL